MDKREINLDIPYMKAAFFIGIPEDTTLPKDKVSALRGGMGEMMLRQYCVADRNCRECRFRKGCLVTNIFYSRMENSPSYVTGKESIGYLLECNDKREHFEKGDVLKFRMTLFGDSITFFTVYLQAFSLLGQNGIGKSHSHFQIIEVQNTQGASIVSDFWVDSSQYQIRDVRSYVQYRRKRLVAQDGLYRITFNTPFSMKYQGKYLNSFCPQALVEGVCRRIQMLNYYTGQETQLPAMESWPVLKSQSVKTASMERYSSTQDKKITLYGISGRAVFSSMPEECLDYLLAGELLHVGKNTSFGFGEYHIDKLTRKEDSTK